MKKLLLITLGLLSFGAVYTFGLVQDTVNTAANVGEDVVRGTANVVEDVLPPYDVYDVEYVEPAYVEEAPPGYYRRYHRGPFRRRVYYE